MKIKKPSITFVLIISIVLAGWVWIVWTKTNATKYQTELGPQIRGKFGFAHGSPYIKAGDKHIEVFTIHPKTDGLLHKAGFKDGDIVVDQTITDFYKMLYHAKGKVVEIKVVDGGDGLPIAQRKTRTISFKVKA